MDDLLIRCPLSRAAQRGFTAIELLVVIAILGILAALAAPSFKPMIERYRVRQVSEALQSTLYLARSEAIRRGGGVVIQKLPNNTNGCTTADGEDEWDCGWVVCQDANGNNKCDAGEAVLHRYDAPSNTMITKTSDGATISLNRWGTVAGSFVGFSLVPKDKSTSDAAALGVCMSSGGRVQAIPPADIPCRG